MAEAEQLNFAGLRKAAAQHLLKEIIEWDPRQISASYVLDVAEAYALVMGTATSRGGHQ